MRMKLMTLLAIALGVVEAAGAPSITNIRPADFNKASGNIAYGPTFGGQLVVITGSGFVDGCTVTFGGTAATQVKANSTYISCRTPAHAAGQVSVIVTNPGPSANGPNTLYEYVTAVIRDSGMTVFDTFSSQQYWAANNTTVTCISTTPSPNGGTYFHVVPVSGTWASGKVCYQDITDNLTAAKSARASTTFAYGVYVNAGHNDTFNVILEYQHNESGTDTPPSWHTVTLGSMALTAASGWQQITGSYTVNWSALDAGSFASGLRWARAYVNCNSTAVGTAYDIDGFTLTESSHVSANLSPVADAVVTGGSVRNITFDARRSADPDGTISSYQWDFDGNGTFDTPTGGSGAQVNYTYSADGIYRAKLRVTDNASNTNNFEFSVIVPFIAKPASFDGFRNACATIRGTGFSGNAAFTTYVNNWLTAERAANPTFANYANVVLGSACDISVTDTGRYAAESSVENPMGAFLYPDGTPRFGMITCTGGTGITTLNAMTGNAEIDIEPAVNGLKFFRNGGCWYGTCSGADMQTAGWTNAGTQNLLNMGGKWFYRAIFGYLPHQTHCWSHQGGVAETLNDGSDGSPFSLGSGHYLFSPLSALGTISTDGNGWNYRAQTQYSYGSNFNSTMPAGRDPQVEYVTRGSAMTSVVAGQTPPMLLMKHYDSGTSLGNWGAYCYVEQENPLAGRIAANFYHPEFGGSFAPGTVLNQAGAVWPEFQNRMMSYAWQRWQSFPVPTKLPLKRNEPVVNTATATLLGDRQFHYYPVNVGSTPARTSFTVTINGMSVNNCDLYLSYGAYPTTTVYDYRSIQGGTTQDTITVNNPAAGNWIVGVYGNHGNVGAQYTITATSSQTTGDSQ